MMEKVLIFIAAIICALLPTSTGQCQIQGADPVIPVRVDVQDIQRGVIFRADTTNVNSIQNSQHSGDALNGGPYFTAVMEDSQFVLSLSNTFADYEEAEYTDTMSILVTFSCAGSTPTASVLFNVHVEDTNNNSPRFIPESYSFSILPPIVPGYELTGCHGDIVARDIDLTTQSIIFSIEENPYFEIEYGGRDPADSKNFFAILRATSVIRSLPEPLTLEISAQDVDLTPDPPRTTFTTITIEADANFEFPEEPVFSEAFYTATYGDDHTITHQDISLSQGYDSNVDFFLSGAQSDYFRISQDENVVSIHGQLPSEVLESNEYSHILLVVHAEREHTSGDKATVIVQLPERTPFRLEFEQVSYRGVITDNVLEVQALGFVEPGTEVITANVVGDYTEYFNAEVNGATVAITMSYLPDQIIEQNNFISIIIEATSGSSTASAVVVFDIIKHDTTTPVFDEIFYVGSYDTIDGVQITNMQLSQGYDENVQFVIDGDGSEYFDVEPNGDSASLILVTPIPQDVISSQHQLTFTIRATKPWTVGASATISIVLPAARILRFEEDEYRGSIQGEELISPPITLIDGYQEDVTFSLSGEYATFFEWENTNNVVTLSLSRDIEVNDIIVLILEATGINAVPSKTAIVLNVVKDDTNTPVFSERVYNGIYFESHEVAVEAAISLSQGYDETVNVFLEGGYSTYFDLVSTGNSYNLVVISPLPTNVMEEQSQLVLTVVASKFNTVGAHAAILLSLPQARDLDFEDDFYEGTLEGESVSLPTIILYEGFREDVAFSLEGDLATFFDALNTGNEVTIRSRSALPADVLETNSNVVMTLQANGEGARVASTVIVLDIIGPDVTTPVFDKYVYTAQYNEAQITVENINLIQGFDDTVSFRLEGDFSEHLNVNVDSSDNSIILGVTSPLPAEVIDSNTILVLTVVADKPGTVGANAALNVELPRELLQFSDTIYIGLIENSILQLEDITLSEGYNEGVSFHLSGDYRDHFIPSNFGNIIRIEVLDTFTPEIQDANAFIVLELHATSQQAISASTTIIIEIVKDSATVISPIFSHSFYPGTFSALTGLQLDEDISLSQGFDDSVTFALTGEHSQYFEVQSEGNSVNLLNPTPIPSAVLAEYSHLIFTIIANKPATPGARSAISISLTDDMSTAAVLRFEQISYSGILDGTNMQMDQIIQVAPTTYEGEFVLTIVGGVYASYFTVSSIDNLVTIDMLNPIPEDIINENAFIVLELKVSGQQAISGQTVVVFETVKDSATVISPIFSHSFYPGTYSALTGLQLDDDISLSQGFDDSVTFALTGEHSQYFEVQSEGNSVNLLNPTPIPSAVLAENSHLIFTIIANKPGTPGARSAISISLTDDMSTAAVLRFEQISYSGILDGTNMQMDQIIQIAPTTYGGEFVLTIVGGVYASYFTVSSIDNLVTIDMLNPIPEDIINENAFIVLELKVSGQQAISGQTVVVFETVKDSATVISPIFSHSFYPGTYSALTGLQLDDDISLSQGFDDSVTFALTGEHSQYFEVQSEGNSVNLLNPTPIPSAVLTENSHLIFTIIANKPGTPGARSAISISLTDDMSTAAVLRFEQISYSGILDGTNMQMDQIIQIAPTTYEGEFVLTIVGGVYASYFTVSSIDNLVTIDMLNPIPEDIINENAFIVLELKVSGQQAISGQTVVVFETLKDSATVISPIFSHSFYPGTYSALTGLQLDEDISLSQGFDDSVTFALTGEHSQYFEVQSEGNSVNLLNPTPIPSAVLAENSHLIFTIIANKPGTPGARSAISISLTDDMSTAAVLRFEQISYSGILDGTNMQMDQIIQIAPTTYEGEFVLTIVGGVYASYFTVSSIDNLVTIDMLNPIPEDIINENAFIVLELKVSGQQAISGQTVVVFETVKDSATVISPIFSHSFYPGTYSALTGLQLDEDISLSQGFDDSVTFALTGEHSQYFEVQSEGNSVNLLNPTPIPSAVLAENSHLIFTIIANKPGTPGARSAISISLTDDMSTAAVLRFEQISYSGILDGTNMQMDQIIQIAPTTYEGEFVLTIVGGVYASYFTVSSIDNLVTIDMLNPIPEDIIKENAFIVLELKVSGQQAISGQTVVVFETVKDSATVISPIFSHSFYPGTYSALTGLQLDDDISLSQGFDDSVTFALTGEHSQYFEVQSEGNSVNLLNPTPIPSAVLAENSHLIFTIIANKPGTPGARSAISISLTDDMSTAAVLRFEQISYSGILDGTNMQMDQIIQIAPTTYEGEFVLTIVGGVYASYFTVSSIDNLVTIDMLNPIPEDIINENAFIVLELKVSGQQAISGQTVVVFETVKDSATVISPIFNHSFYPGTYSALTGLQLDEDISLSQGFDDSVTFALTGEHSQYFEVQSEGNSVNLLNPTPIPSAVLAENSHLIFTIIANKPGTPGARSAISISLTDDMSTAAVLRFEQISYSGILDGTNMQMDQIIQIAPTTYEGEFVLTIVGGVYASYFTVSSIDNLVTIDMLNPIPEDIINKNAFIVLELKVSGQQAISGQTVVVFETVKDSATVISPIFSHSFYPGTYSALTGLQLDEDISLSQGFDDSVTFALTGEHSQYFEVQSEGNSVNLLNATPIPSAVLAENSHLIFTIIANKPGTPGARSAISISLTDDMSTAAVLRFEQISYSGILDGTNMQMDQIIQIAPTTYEGEFVLTIVGGVYASYFTVSSIDNLVTIDMLNPIPEDIINENAFIVLELKVSGQQAISGQTVVVFETVKDSATVISPIFCHSFYPGTYSALTGLQLDEDISLSQGFDDSVTFALTGEHSQYFEVQSEGNSVNLLNPTPIPSAVLAENSHLIFTIIANKPGTPGARSAITISLTDDMSTAAVLRFEQISYSGILDGTNMQMDQIIQIAPTTYEGEFVLTIVGGVYASYFTVSSIDNLVTIDMLNPIPEDIINENAFIVLELKVSGQQAISGQTVVVFETVKDSATVISPIFSHSFYPGTYSALTGLQLDEDISLSQGFDDSVTFALTGEHSQYFEVQSEGNSVNLLNPTPIPSAVLAENSHLIFTIIANKPGTPGARSAISISLTDGSGGSVSFDRALYTGSFEQGVTNHEPIFVYGFTGTEVHISGDYSSELRAAVSEDGQVEVLATEGASVPAHIAYLPLLLQADTARTALVLSVIHPISPDPPSVTFEHDSYVLRTDVAQSGLLARLTATANNGETIVYSLVLDNSHLEERLSVSSDGDLWLSAPADSGVYQFSVRATTIATQVSAEATVHLTVDSVVVCGDENRVLQPLIVLERDEEEPHDNLIILNEDLAADCSYEFTYRWPSDRDWIYINEQGHISARIIDREDPAIAFMALSQIQIELVLTCSNDDIISRQRRDVFAQNRTLGPYDYGQSDWILTEGIGYNARRSFVNLIVNDINDNPPIFIRKEDEPIIVGYPVESLLEVVNPSPLIIVQATDADIGVNAELVYWSSATELAVSSRTGAVYVRDNAAGLLQSGTIFTISATDLAGAPGGHTGHIDIMVRLLELDNIIVLSIRNALLDDEQEIIKLLSEALQYDIKSLGATVISDQYEVEDESDVSSRLPSKHFYDATFSEALNVNFTKRLERLAEVDESGATLRIFIYGLLNSEVVEAAQLKSDIEHSEILEELTTFQVQHLQEHLDNIIRVIGSPGGNTGLLVSTIVLACLLFIVIVAIGSWFFFKWWKARKYKQFRDSTSVSNETLETLPKLEDALRPRPKIEEIKRTERRLKQMLEQPVVATPPVAPLVEIETRNGTMDMPTPRTVTFETVSEQPTQPDKPLPIVIQSIDKLKTDEDTEDEDEFGEKLSTRRKSVVTFNEQVEKIITVDNIDPDDDADVIVERL